VLRFFRRDEDFASAALNLGEFDEPALAEVDAAVRCRRQPPRITVREICRRLDADAATNAQNRSPGPKTPARAKVLLMAADGEANTRIAVETGVTP
jgi:DNA-binding NarL/FixJ family response regulator